MAIDSTSSAGQWHIDGNREAVEDDPLTDCLVALTQLFDRPLSAHAARAGLPLDDGKLTPDLFPRAAARGGLSARLVKRRLHRIPDVLLPGVLLLRDRQACVLLKIDRSNNLARVLLPETGTGEQTLSVADLKRRYIGYAILVRPEHPLDDRVPTSLLVGGRYWFWKALFRNWRSYRDVLIASFLVNAFALALPIFILTVYDRVLPHNAFETLWVLSIGVAIIVGFDFVIRGLRTYFIDRAGRRVDLELSAGLFEKAIGLKSEVRPNSVGAFANNLHEFEGVRDFITSTTVTVLVDLPFAVVFLVAIWLIGGPLVLVPLVAIPMILIYALIIQWPLRRSVEKTFRAAAQKNATLVESLVGVETIKTHCAESQLQRRWEHSIEFISRWSMRARLLSASTTHFAILIQHLGTVGIVAFGAYLASGGELSLGGLIACVIIGRRAMSPMTQMANLATRYHHVRAALKTLNKIVALPVERDPNRMYVMRDKIKGSIELQNVSFSYPQQEAEILKNVSFRMNPGEHVAVVGRMGSGKTTLAKLILGLYEPTTGTIAVDGVDIRQLDPTVLRRLMGYVPQDVILFYGSVRENIVLGAPHADDVELLRVAKIAGVSEFADRHPRGYEFTVGERGAGLSGGQRQSVAIARALLFDPPVLLVDEPTNSMDNQSEAKLRAALSDALVGKTFMLVTHRSSMLELVDRIVILDNGAVVADGPKAEILEALDSGKIRAMG
jgi:ATP-binding cassette subfamily C protein LapB